MNEKTTQCLTNPSQHIPIYLEQFPSYSNRKCKKLPFLRTAAHIFVSPADDPAIITQYVAWMERKYNACQTPRSMYPSIFNSFPVIRAASAKNRSFHVPQPTFCFPWRRPCDYHAMCCMDGKTFQCLSNPWQHVPIYLQQFPSYSNRKCKKSPFSRTAAHIFVSSGDAPGAITLNVVWMEREFDAYKLSRSMYTSIFNSFPVIRNASSKNRHFHVPQPTFLFPLETPL